MKRLFAAFTAVLAADQIAKYLVVEAMGLGALGEIEILPPYLNLRMAWNYGINFGLFAGPGDAWRWALIVVSLAISAIAVWWAIRSGGFWLELSVGILAGGAVGNAVDRLVHGAVADFVNMSCCGIENPYSFNVADVAVVFGAIGIVLFPGERKTP